MHFFLHRVYHIFNSTTNCCLLQQWMNLLAYQQEHFFAFFFLGSTCSSIMVDWTARVNIYVTSGEEEAVLSFANWMGSCRIRSATSSCLRLDRYLNYLNQGSKNDALLKSSSGCWYWLLISSQRALLNSQTAILSSASATTLFFIITQWNYQSEQWQSPIQSTYRTLNVCVR